MGLFDRLKTWLWPGSHEEVRLVVQGLDSSGKTTLLYRLKLGQVITTIPTIGFNVETVQHKNMTITMWDVGGRDRIRPLWRHYYPGTKGFVFIIDSNDKERLEDAREQLFESLQDPMLAHVPVLVYANKQDLPGALSVREIAQRLRLHELSSNHQWHIQAATATEGDGLKPGLSWLVSQIEDNILSDKKLQSTLKWLYSKLNAHLPDKETMSRSSSSSRHVLDEEAPESISSTDGVAEPIADELAREDSKALEVAIPDQQTDRIGVVAL